MSVGPIHTSPTRIVKFHRNKMKTEKDACYVNKMNFVVGKVECEMPLNVSISCVQNSRVIRHENKEAAKPICETRRNTHRTPIPFIGHQIKLSIRHTRPHAIRLSVNLESSIFRIVFFSFRVVMENLTAQMIFCPTRYRLPQCHSTHVIGF